MADEVSDLSRTEFWKFLAFYTLQWILSKTFLCSYVTFDTHYIWSTKIMYIKIFLRTTFLLFFFFIDNSLNVSIFYELKKTWFDLHKIMYVYFKISYNFISGNFFQSTKPISQVKHFKKRMFIFNVT